MTARAHPRSLTVTARLLLGATLFLAGCSLLGGDDHPATLYRFGNTSAPASTPDTAPTGQVRLVSYRGAEFPVESRGDRILTTTGSSVAYVAESRWIAPAADLFDTALRREFARSLPGIRLIGPAGGPRPDFALSVEVRRFEAAYEGALAPVVTMEANVKLMRWTDRAIVGEWTFSARKPAADNRVAAIVSAYDEATVAIIGDIETAVNRFAGSPSTPIS